MRWLLSILRNRYFLIGLGLVLAIGLVLVLGAWFQWSWTIRLLAIIGVLIVAILGMVLSFVRANRSADQIEKSIRQQAEQQLVSTRPDRRAEIEELQQQLNEAIEKLKTSKLGRGKRGRAALYALPWYMFIGPPGSGKTTAIANSGLNFPIGSDRVRGVGGTRNCDWFFSDQAILLDTAGRYMTQEEDTDEWYAFLDTLKEYRSDRPINGVIVGISMDELLNASRDDIDWHADNIRRRIDELVSRLGVRFPVYLVFTKTDLLQGFVEFFGEFSRREREQIWGATLEQEIDRKPEDEFEDEFDRLYDELIDRRTARLSRPMKRSERQKVYAFPLQFALAKKALSQFVARLFQPNPYQESPVFRGFFFTSGTQEGVPLDQVIQSIANQFELPSTVEDDFDVESETKSYFIKDFFTDVVVTDQYMVRRTSKASREGSLRRIGVTVAAVVLLGLFILGASQGFVRSRAELSDAKETATEAAAVNWSNPRAMPDNLAHMDQLRQQMDELSGVSLLSFGFSRRNAVEDPIQELYRNRARGFVQQYPFEALEQQIRELTREARDDVGARDELYGDLKAYLLMTQETARLEDEEQREALTRHLRDIAAPRVEPHANLPTPGEVEAAVGSIASDYVTALHEQPERYQFAATEQLIEGARRSLSGPIDEYTIYRRISQNGKDRFGTFTLSDALSSNRYLSYFSGQPEVSGFYTKEAWETYVQAEIDAQSKDPQRDEWVMGDMQRTVSEELSNPEQLAADLEQLYFNEYSQAWQRFLSSVRVDGFSSLREASRALTDLSESGSSPIGEILGHVTQQTTFMNRQAQEVAGNIAERAGRAIRSRTRGVIQDTPGQDQVEQEIHPVDRRFQSLHALEADRFQSQGANEDLYEAFDALREVGSTLEEVSNDPAKAAEFAANILQNGGGLLSARQRSMNNALSGLDPEVRSNLFDLPISYAWGAVVRSAQEFMNERWRTEVYEPYRNSFANRYPFDPSSDLGAPTLDVEQYFHPQDGVVAVFLVEDLRPFIGRDLDRPQTWNGQGIRLSSQTRRAIERAQAIGNNLYSSGMMEISFEMRADNAVRETAAAPAVDRMILELHGQRYEYTMGYTDWEPFRWPSRSGASLTLSTAERDYDINYPGDWAFFRMLEDARIERVSSSSFKVNWTFAPTNSWRITAVYDLQTDSASNPFSDPRSF
ncbi:MAG: type VI secretion system membrane subunit TssM, partial [Bacteroidetes bacterium]|nr:type VI secretion system membrane subunit TssM [Bacteroidota bacterium]